MHAFPPYTLSLPPFFPPPPHFSPLSPSSLPCRLLHEEMGKEPPIFIISQRPRWRGRRRRKDEYARANTPGLALPRNKNANLDIPPQRWDVEGELWDSSSFFFPGKQGTGGRQSQKAPDREAKKTFFPSLKPLFSLCMSLTDFFFYF